MAKLNIGLEHVVIEDIYLVLEVVEEWLEEGATELTNAVET